MKQELEKIMETQIENLTQTWPERGRVDIAATLLYHFKIDQKTTTVTLEAGKQTQNMTSSTIASLANPGHECKPPNEIRQATKVEVKYLPKLL